MLPLPISFNIIVILVVIMYVFTSLTRNLKLTGLITNTSKGTKFIILKVVLVLILILILWIKFR